ncbi:MAG: hypothetical protein KGI51_15400 [Rhodospirillales bacterium]|nr:hypothetical protein [Rhodospirillales bacterium]
MLTALALLAATAALGGCVAYPDGYYGYAPGYYAPPVTVGIGGWWGWHHDDDDWGEHGWHGGWRR